MIPDEPIKPSRKALTVLKVGEYIRASVEFATDHGVKFLRNELVLSLEARVLSEKLEEGVKTDYVDIPSSWWQHLKYEHAPGWFIDRWPVQYDRATLTVYLERWATYPEANVRHDKRLGNMVVQDIASQSTELKWTE